MASQINTLRSERRPQSIDRRAEPRVPAEGEGFVTLAGPTLSRKYPLRILEISRSGLQVELTTSFPPATEIELHFGKVVVLGAVKSCSATASGRYRLGVRTRQVIESRRA